MPMGCYNVPATHQPCVSLALKDHIGKFCHVYLDNIVIWSQLIDKHKRNIATILESLCCAHLYCLMKKSNHFCSEIDFLGHYISLRGIEADSSKVQHIMDWPRPHSAKDLCCFLRLVCYISAFLPQLAKHTFVLSPLTCKECNSDFPPWTPDHQAAFDAIKGLVLSRTCLTTIEYISPGENKIFMTCNASKCQMGAVLLFGPTWEAARPVAFESHFLKGIELHYPTHKQELLLIIHALQKWCSDLLGSRFIVFTDHKTLQNFDGQKNLSMHQMQWMEYLSQYKYTIYYINGEANCITDTLFCYPETIAHNILPPSLPITSIPEVNSDPSFLDDICTGYIHNSWCSRLIGNVKNKKLDFKLDVTLHSGLLFTGNCLIIPRFKGL